MKEYIVITPSNLKKKVIELSRKKYYNYNIKFMSINEFIDKYTFSYDNKTIYNIMNKYNINLSSTLVYLNNLCYISNKLNNSKMILLKDIKKYLEDNNLLIYDNRFREYVKDKEIHIYGYNYINKYYLNIFKDREKVNNIWKCLGLQSYEELIEVLDKLTVVEIDVTKEEIASYTEGMISNKAKLKNHPEEISYDDIFNIYYNSLI